MIYFVFSSMLFCGVWWDIIFSILEGLEIKD